MVVTAKIRPSKLAVESYGGAVVGAGRIFGGRIHAQTLGHAVAHDVCSKLVARARHAFERDCCVPPSGAVMQILHLTANAQIQTPVIKAVIVDVIDNQAAPRTNDQAMHEHSLTVARRYCISVAVGMKDAPIERINERLVARVIPNDATGNLYRFRAHRVHGVSPCP